MTDRARRSLARAQVENGGGAVGAVEDFATGAADDGRRRRRTVDDDDDDDDDDAVWMTDERCSMRRCRRTGRIKGSSPAWRTCGRRRG